MSDTIIQYYPECDKCDYKMTILLKKYITLNGEHIEVFWCTMCGHKQTELT